MAAALEQMKQLEISMAGEIKPEAEVRVRVLKRLL